MPQPYPNLGDIGVIFRGVRRGRGAQSVHAGSFNLDACRVSPLGNYLIDPATRNASSGDMDRDRAGPRALPRLAFIASFQVLMNSLGSDQVKG
jgi:hypothetical protein